MNNKEARELMKLHGHKFDYCSSCGPMIRCGYCKNNCCNGGSGENCKDNCEEAYNIQDSVTFPIIHKIRFYWGTIIGMYFYKYVKVPISNFFYKLYINYGIKIGKK